MGVKSKYEKVLAQKKILLADAPGQKPKSLSYPYALEVVRSHRQTGNYHLGNYCLEQIADQVTIAPEPTVYLLHAYLDSMRVEEAQRLAVFLRDEFPVDSLALRARTRFHQVTGELGEAKTLMLKAVQIHPNNSKNLEMLAILYRSLGDMQRALDCYDRALRIEPDFCSALFGKARLLGASATPNFIAQIRAAIKSHKFSGAQLASLQFAMALVYADIDVDLHFFHLNEANRAMAAIRGFDVAANNKEVRNVLYRFRQPVVDALRKVVADDFKPIFVVGMPRSGTTLLEQIIGAHPQCQPIGEACAFFNAITAADKLGCPPLDTSSMQAIDDCRQYFLRVADNYKNNRLVAAAASKHLVEKSMDNHFFIGLILLTMPNARVINIERHPLAVVYSCYQQYFEAGNGFSFNLEWAAEYYKTYKALMMYWKAIFPEKILTVHYEQLVRDNQHEVEKILKFCDLEWDAACLAHEKSVGLVTTSSDNQVRQPVYQSSTEKWKKVESHLESAKRILGEWLDYPK